MPRDIRIQPNRSTTGSTQQPTIFFSGTTAASINLKVEDDGSLTFEGNNGGLFNITDSKDGLLSSVNDVSGLPIFSVYSSDKIIAGGYNQNALVVDNDKVFVGTNTVSVPTGTKLIVSGNTLVYGSLTANTILNYGQTVNGNLIVTGTTLLNTLTATTPVFYGTTNVRGNLIVTGTSSFSTLTATTPVFYGTTTINGNLIVTGTTLLNTLTATTPVFYGTTNINGNLIVTGTTSVRSITGTSALFSGSGQNILTVIGSGNSTTAPIFTVQGSSGELFSITDSLVGSLFSVNDISGLPILEVFSNNTTLMGSYLAPSLNTTVKTTANSGTTTIYSIPTSAYTGGYFDYNVLNTAGARSGNIIAIWSGNTVNYTEVTTNDIGNTTPITFNMTVTSGLALLRVSATTNSWTVKTIVRSI
jgi:hypothetical protein